MTCSGMLNSSVFNIVKQLALRERLVRNDSILATFSNSLIILPTVLIPIGPSTNHFPPALIHVLVFPCTYNSL